MKPRLLIAHLTEEDFQIWDRLSEPFGGSLRFEDGVPLRSYAEAHLRDADLMLYAQQNKRYGWARVSGDTLPVLPGQYVDIRGGSRLGAA